MRRRKMRTVAKRYWRTTGIESGSWRPQDFVNWDRVSAMPVGLRGEMIRALVDTAPSGDRRREIGVGLFEDFFHEDPTNAVRAFTEARLSDIELELTLSSVYPWMFERYLQLGRLIPLPPDSIAHLLDERADSRDAAFASLARAWSAHDVSARREA